MYLTSVCSVPVPHKSRTTSSLGRRQQISAPIAAERKAYSRKSRSFATPRIECPRRASSVAQREAYHGMHVRRIESRQVLGIQKSRATFHTKTSVRSWIALRPPSLLDGAGHLRERPGIQRCARGYQDVLPPIKLIRDGRIPHTPDTGVPERCPVDGSKG